MEQAPWQRTAAGAGLLGADGRLTPTVFAEMTALATKTGALNLGQGFPDEDGPAVVLEAAREAIASGANQYPPGRGIPALRKAIAVHQSRFYDHRLDPDREVLVTAGAAEAFVVALIPETPLLFTGTDRSVFAITTQDACQAWARRSPSPV